MNCEDAEAESEEKSDCHLPKNSARSTSPVSSREKFRKRFLDKIDTINTTFMVDVKTSISQAIKQLENIHLLLQKSCASINGIPLRTSPVKKKLKITSTKYHQVFHKKLPPRRCRKKTTPKPEVVVVEDSIEDVHDRETKKKVSCMFV